MKALGNMIKEIKIKGMLMNFFKLTTVLSFSLSISNKCERKSLFDSVNSTNKINDKHNRTNIAYDGLTSRIKDGCITKKNTVGLFFHGVSKVERCKVEEFTFIHFGIFKYAINESKVAIPDYIKNNLGGVCTQEEFGCNTNKNHGVLTKWIKTGSSNTVSFLRKVGEEISKD